MPLNCGKGLLSNQKFKIMKISEIQKLILDETGIKTSVKKGRGSMKGYTIFSPIFQGGEYPKFPFQWRVGFKDKFPKCDIKTMFVSEYSIDVYHGVELDAPLRFKKERKPKPISEQKVREWGSKNSQLRLDKAAARYAKKRRGTNGDNMVKYW